MHCSQSVVFTGAVQSLLSKALFQTIYILNKRSRKGQQMCKGEVVRQKHPSWGNPPSFLFNRDKRRSPLAPASGRCIPAPQPLLASPQSFWSILPVVRLSSELWGNSFT